MGAHRLLTNSRVERARDRVLSGDRNSKLSISLVMATLVFVIRAAFKSTTHLNPRQDPCYHRCIAGALGVRYHICKQRSCTKNEAEGRHRLETAE